MSDYGAPVSEYGAPSSVCACDRTFGNHKEKDKVGEICNQLQSQHSNDVCRTRSRVTAAATQHMIMVLPRSLIATEPRHLHTTHPAPSGELSTRRKTRTRNPATPTSTGCRVDPPPLVVASSLPHSFQRLSSISSLAIPLARATSQIFRGEGCTLTCN